MQEPLPVRIVIIGGGFSGAMTAVNLARLSERPLHVTIINHRCPLGRGVAYSAPRPELLLNVAARNMSAFRDEPDHFLQWLRTRSEFESTPEIELRERFIPRMIYGDYLRSLVQHHLQSPGGMTPVSTEFITGEVVDIETTAAGPVQLRLSDGSTREADRVVLATGNEKPAALPGTETVAEDRAWIGDPWQTWEKKLPAEHGSVVILGTGLTAVDAVITLRAAGWMGSIHAASRHGWFPHAHFRGIEYPEFPPAGVDLAALGLERLVALIREHCSSLSERNANPAIIVDKLRSHTQRIWGQFTRDERLLFARQYAARWNVLRHRIAPDIHAQITSSQLTGQLQVHASGIERLEQAGSQIVIRLENGKTLAGDLVLNATGPATKITASRSTLLQNLLRRGLVTPDDTEMGVRVDADHTVITGQNERSSILLALGPLLRGTYWETIAVPELRGQARRVAETLLDRPYADDIETREIVEYMI